MKLASRDRALERLHSRTKRYDEMKKQDGHKRPGSMNPRKGSGLRARHS